MANAVVSGALRLSSTSSVITRTFSAFVTVSTIFTDQFVLAAGVSEFVVSVPTISNPGVLVLTATGTCRVNFGNLPSSTSHASAGYQFTDMFAQVGSGISGALALHFANSGSDSATITVFAGQ